MQTKYLLLEAVCFYDNEGEFKCPTAGNISNSCIFTKEGISVCEYLFLQKARAAIAVTDDNGNAVNGSEYFGGFELSDEEYVQKEKEWVSKCSELIDEL